MTSIKYLGTDLVYRNPKPYLRSLHADLDAWRAEMARRTEVLLK